MNSNIDDNTYYDLNGLNKYILSDEAISSGGEGMIFKVNDQPDLVAKIYYEKNRTENRKNKLLAMLETNADDLSECAWPQTILYQNGTFCGFIMKKVTGLNSLIDFYVYDNRKNYTWSKYIQVAKNIAAAVNNVHDSGHIIGDLNPNNFMLDVNTGRVMLVDTDSYHIRNKVRNVFPCTVVTPEFIPPELQGKNIDENNAGNMFNENTDNFALAVIIFRILMNGVHPFSCVVTTKKSMSDFQPIKNIQNGYCPYFTESNFNGLMETTKYSPSIDILPKNIQFLFKKAFVYGFKNPKLRPKPAEWFYALSNLNHNLCRCSSNSNHEFFIGNASCPWCALKNSIKQNKFGFTDDLKVDSDWENYKKTKKSKTSEKKESKVNYVFPPTCPICGSVLVNGKCLSCKSSVLPNIPQKPNNWAQRFAIFLLVILAIIILYGMGLL